MNLHITPSFNIDRLCKTASVLLFLVYCLNQLALERSSKNGMHVGVCMRRILKYFLLKLTKLLYGI